MARRKANENAAPSSAFTEGKKLFQRIELSQLEALARDLFPTREVVAKGSGLVINCTNPSHPDNKPSMTIDPKQGWISCWSCGYRTRNILQWLRDSLGLSYPEALRKVQDATGVRIGTRVEKELDNHETYVQYVELLLAVSQRYLQNLLIGDETPIALESARPALQWFFDERGHDRNSVHLFPVGLMPPPTTREELAPKLLTERADRDYKLFKTTAAKPERREQVLEAFLARLKDLQPEWTNAWLYVTGHSLTMPARVRLRRPGKDKFIRILEGSRPDEPTGFWNLYNPVFSEAMDPKGVQLLVVEGENDALSLQESIYREGRRGLLVIGSCGSDTETEALKEAGFNEAQLMSDAYTAQGEKWLLRRLHSGGDMTLGLFDAWHRLPPEYQLAKDPDEIVQSGGFETLFKLFKEPGTFVPPEEWALRRLLDRLPDNSQASSASETAGLIVEYAQALRHPAAREKFLLEAEAKTGVPSGVVRPLIEQGGDTDRGMLARFEHALRQDFHFLYLEHERGGVYMAVEHRATSRSGKLPLDSGKSVVGYFAAFVGSVLDYVQARVGLPQARLASDKAQRGDEPVLDLQVVIGDYLFATLQLIAPTVPPIDQCERVGAGVHYVHNQHYALRLDPARLYVNDAKVVYRLWDDGADHVRLERLNSHADKHLLFRRDEAMMCPWIEELPAVNDVTLEDVQWAYATLTELFRVGWRFTHHDVDPEMLALLMFVFAAGDVFDHHVVLSLIGPSSSGKSTAISLFAGGQYPANRLLPYVSYQSGYTMASIQQALHLSPALLVLEEFSRDSSFQTHKGAQVENVNEMLRQIIFPGGHTGTRGRSKDEELSQRRKEYRLRTNVLTSSLTQARDIQDVNRRFYVETVKKPGFADPSQLVNSVLPDKSEAMLRMRRTLLLAPLKYHARLREAEAACYAELASGTFFDTPVESRFLRNFYGVGAVLSLLDQDWRSFVRKVTETRKEWLDSTSAMSADQEVFKALLRTNALTVAQGANPTSVQAILAHGTPDHEFAINGAKKGIYIVREGDSTFLCVEWTALMGDNAYSKQAALRAVHARALRETANQHASALRPEAMAYVLRVLSEWGLLFSPSDVTVYDVTALRAELQAKTKHAVSLTEGAKGHGAASDPDAPPGFSVPPGSTKPKSKPNFS